MYSGITQGLFAVVIMNRRFAMLDYALHLNANLVQKLNIGSSVNVDGVCQSVTKIDKLTVHFTAIEETLRCTTLCQLHVGQLVSVEPSLRVGDEVGGHWLSGHINGTAQVIAIHHHHDNLSLRFACSPNWMKYIVPKGFLGIDGSSLTVGETAAEGEFEVHLIPETLRVTHFASKKIGDLVNIELDQHTVAIVNHLERILEARGLLAPKR